MLERAVAILGDLIAFPTISRQSNMEMIAYLAARLEDAGARVEVFTAPEGGRANVWATLGLEGDGGLVLSGHTDVVPVKDQPWSVEPFAMSQSNGRLYGRGTCDMKGFIACCLAALPELAKGGGPVHFAFTYDEEIGCLGARHLCDVIKDKGIRPGMAIIGEPTEMRVIEGHKGCCEYTVTFDGLEGHGSAPDLGVNAVEYAARYVSRLLELRKELKTRAPRYCRFDPPWSTINVGRLSGGVAHNVIAAKAEVAWEMRPVNVADEAFVKTEIGAYANDVLLPEMQSVFPGASIETLVEGEVAGLLPMEENAARDLVAGLTGANGADVVPFGTEAGLFQALGMDVVVCGPGSIQQAHKADEFIEIDQLTVCLDLLARVTRKRPES